MIEFWRRSAERERMQVGRRLLFRVWHFLSRNEAVEEVYRGPAGPSGTQRDSTGATETDNRGKGGGEAVPKTLRQRLNCRFVCLFLGRGFCSSLDFKGTHTFYLVLHHIVWYLTYSSPFTTLY